jgi:hypothetical protein
MTENSATPESRAEPLDEQASENLEFFMGKIGAASVADRLPAYDKRIMADLPLAMQLEPVPLRPDYSDYEQKTYNFFRSNHWLPKQQWEATLATTGEVDKILRRAERFIQGDPEKAAAVTHSNIKRYYSDAENDVSSLNNVLVPEEWEIKPDITRLRGDRGALYVMADNLMAKEFFAHNQWPRSNQKVYKDRQKYWRGFMLFAAENASDQALEEVFDDVIQKARRRLDFWRDKYQILNQKVGHLLVKDVQEPAAEKKAQVEVGKQPTEEIDSFEQLLSDQTVEEMVEAALKYSHKAHRIETLVHQGVPRDLAERRVLGRQAVYFKGQLVGVEPKDDKPSAEARVRADTHKKSNASNKPSIRRLPGYDHEDDPSNPWHY